MVDFDKTKFMTNRGAPERIVPPAGRKRPPSSAGPARSPRRPAKPRPAGGSTPGFLQKFSWQLVAIKESLVQLFRRTGDMIPSRKQKGASQRQVSGPPKRSAIPPTREQAEAARLNKRQGLPPQQDARFTDVAPERPRQIPQRRPGQPTPEQLKQAALRRQAVQAGTERLKQGAANEGQPDTVKRIGRFRAFDVVMVSGIAALAALLVVVVTFPDDDGEAINLGFTGGGLPSDLPDTVRPVQTSTITVARPAAQAEPIVVETFKLPDERIPANCGLALSPVEHPNDFLFFNDTGEGRIATNAMMVLDGQTVRLARIAADGPPVLHGQHSLQTFTNDTGSIRVAVEAVFAAAQSNRAAVREGVVRIAMPSNRVTAIAVSGYVGCVG